MNAEIISVAQSSTDTSDIKYVMKKCGIGFISETVIPDLSQLREKLNDALCRCNFVIILAPPDIDGNCEVINTVCDLLNIRCTTCTDLLRHIAEHCAEHDIPLPPNAGKAAVIPENCQLLEYPGGMIPAKAINSGSQHILILPNDSQSLHALIDADLTPYFYGITEVTSVSQFFRMTDVTPETAAKMLFSTVSDSVAVNIEPSPYGADVTVTVSADDGEQAGKLCQSECQKILSRFSAFIFAQDNTSLPETVVNSLKKAKKKVATAESCTGGLLSKLLTDVDGASEVFELGITAYSGAIKNKILNIPMETIDFVGTVNPQVSKLMAQNVREMGESDYGIGITGVAGDTFEGKPEGLVYISITDGKSVVTRELHVPPTEDGNNRSHIRNTAAASALNMLRIQLLNSAEKRSSYEQR